MVLENFLRDVDILWDRVGKSLHERPDALVGRKMRVQVVNASIVEDLTGYALNLGWKSMSDETKFGLDAFTVVDATKGIFELEYTSGMLSNYGSLRGTLQLVPPVGNTVESNNFGITVKKSAIDSEAIQSETSFTALTTALVSVQNLESTYAPELNSVKQQLADKIGGGVKAEPEDLSATTLGLVTGTGGPINLLSIPQDLSVIPTKTSFLKIGKNKFNKIKTTPGYWYDYTDGVKKVLSILSHSENMPLLTGVTYIISGTTEIYVTHFNSLDVFVSGQIANATSAPTFTVPEGVSYTIISVKTTSLDTFQVEQGTEVTAYESYKVTFSTDITEIQTINQQIAGLSSKLAVNPTKTSFLKIGKNKFNKIKTTPGYWYDYTDGVKKVLSTLSHSENMPLLTGVTYIISGTTEIYVAHFNDLDVFVSGQIANATNAPTFTVPEGVSYTIISVKTTSLDTFQVEQGTEVTAYESYKVTFSTDITEIQTINQQIAGLSSKLAVNYNDIIVKKDGTGDFISLVSAIQSITDSSETNVYNIYVHAGTYDIVSELGTYVANITTSEQVGVVLPDYVNLIGVGKNVWIKGEIPIEILTQQNCEYFSTLNLKYNNVLENLKITAKNCRYAVHDESNDDFKNFKRNLKDLYIEHLGNQAGYWASLSGYGMGTSSGSILKADNCVFISPTRSGFSCHDNVNFEDGCFMQFDNCRFICADPLSSFNGFRASTFGAGSKENLCVINNSSFTGLILAEEVVGAGNRWRVIGGGNTKAPYSRINTVGVSAMIQFGEETKVLRNVSGVTITKGTPVKYSNGGIIPVALTAETYLVVGIAFEDIVASSVGVVKTSGFFSFDDFGIVSGVTTGDKIGITAGGSIGVVTGVEYLGVSNGLYGKGKGIFLRGN